MNDPQRLQPAEIYSITCHWLGAEAAAVLHGDMALAVLRPMAINHLYAGSTITDAIERIFEDMAANGSDIVPIVTAMGSTDKKTFDTTERLIRDAALHVVKLGGRLNAAA